MQHNGVFLEKEPHGDHRFLIENGEMKVIGMGTTVSTLVIDCIDHDKAGQYTCVADNRCSEPIETSAMVAVKDAGTAIVWQFGFSRFDR